MMTAAIARRTGQARELNNVWSCAMGRSVAMIATALVASLMLAPTSFALAGEPAPVCRVTSVLDVMSRELRKRIYYIRIDPKLVWEEPTADRTVVHCGVCALVAAYAMPRFGEDPVLTCEPHAFDVRALQAGFVIRFLR